jgi:hypothetical protein
MRMRNNGAGTLPRSVETLARYSTRPSRMVLSVGLWGLGMAAAAIAAGGQTARKGAAPAASAPSYSRDIRPILAARCTVCHSAATSANTAVSGGLALDTLPGIKQGVAGRKGAPTLTPGRSSASQLYERLVATSPSRLMPKGGPPLPAAQIALIKQWIDANAPAGAAVAGAAPKATGASAPMPRGHAGTEVQIPTKAELPSGILQKGASTATLSARVGPLPPVTAVAYSPDGKRLAIGGYRAVAVWDTATGQPLTCLTHLPGAVLALSFKPDGSLLAVGGGIPGASGEVRVYNTTGWAQAGKPLAGHTDAVASVCWSSDGSKLASGSQDKSARVWEWPSGKELRTFKDHSDGVTRVCFSPDGKALYTASLDHNARRFDVEKGGLVRLFTGHNDGITALAVSPDGKRLITSGNEPNLRWWNVETGETTNNNGGHGAPVSDVAFAKDGSLVVSASADKTVRVWDGANTQPKRALEGSSDWAYTAAISPDDKYVVGGGADGMARLWEAATGRLRLTLTFWPPQQDGSAFDWLLVTPEGYADGSPGWSKLLSVANVAKGVPAGKVQAALHDLLQPQSVLKAWQAAALDPVKPAAK